MLVLTESKELVFLIIFFHSLLRSLNAIQQSAEIVIYRQAYVSNASTTQQIILQMFSMEPHVLSVLLVLITAQTVNGMKI
jgi:hypothetical protein